MYILADIIIINNNNITNMEMKSENNFSRKL